MKPFKDWTLRPLWDLENYLNSDCYFCNAIHFSPEEDGVDFADKPGIYPPPFIEICDLKNWDTYYFEIPEIVAYYAVKHPGYTFEGLDRKVVDGIRKAKKQIRESLGVEEKSE